MAREHGRAGGEETIKRHERGLDLQRADTRIVRDLSIRTARSRGIMSDGWMGSFRADEATEEDLGAAEYPLDQVMRYTHRLREMADEAERLLREDEIENSPENVALVWARALQLRREANMYFDPRLKRPGIDLNAFFSWQSHTESMLEVAKAKSFSLVNILRVRFDALEAELSGQLSFVRGGGWKNAGERRRVLKTLKGMRGNETQKDIAKLWSDAGGTTEELSRYWETLTATVQRYERLLSTQKAPEHDQILGPERVREHLRELGIVETAEKIVERCKRETSIITAEIDRLTKQYPDAANDTSTPKSNKEILAVADTAREWMEHCIHKGLLIGPNPGQDNFSLAKVAVKVRTKGKENELSFASMSSDGRKINFISAKKTDRWQEAWKNWVNTMVHEFTHVLQRHAPAEKVDLPMGAEAREGAAVAMEWLWLQQQEQVDPATVLAMLRRERRHVERMSLALQFQQGTITRDQVMTAVHDLAPNDRQRNDMVDQITTSLELYGAYYLGPRWIAALAEHGDLEAAMHELSQYAQFRVPGHLLIPGIDPKNFSLAVNVPETPLFVRYSRKKFPAVA